MGEGGVGCSSVTLVLSLITLEKIVFRIKINQGVNNCLKPLILSVFSTVASRLKSEQKEKEKYILKLNATRFKLINP